jgi:peptide-methionine (S)-S-oxide reductase
MVAATGVAGLALLATSWAGRSNMSSTAENPPAGAAKDRQPADDAKLEKATFGTGCFWCTEAVFDQLKGVQSIISGYSGGNLPDPTYEQVCGGLTGHAEVVQVTFDPAVISYPELLEVFWQTHDPTTLNRQGNDIGTQYRSAIFYHNDKQRELAEHYKRKLDESGAFRGPIVTEVTAFTNFYPAEKHHQDYFAQNPNQPYCAMIIGPKVDKFKKAFGDKLKDAAGSAK